MAIQPIYGRLLGIQQVLIGIHRASDPLSSISKGIERDAFIAGFLREVMPTIY